MEENLRTASFKSNLLVLILKKSVYCSGVTGLYPKEQEC